MGKAGETAKQWDVVQTLPKTQVTALSHARAPLNRSDANSVAGLSPKGGKGRRRELLHNDDETTN